MKNNTFISFLFSMFLTVLLIGCDYNTTNVKPEQTITDEIEESAETAEFTENAEFAETITNIPDTVTHTISDIELNNTYTTRYGKVNLITYPAFSFDYPDGWTIKSEEVSPTEEKVILTNDVGTTITYWYFGTLRDLEGPTHKINSVDVTPVANASFNPGYVQATDYSDLGTFMVAKLETTRECDLLAGGESVNVERVVRYALLPESEAGEQYESFIVGLPTFSFFYAGHISVIATTSNKEFTEQEEREVIAILASFREVGFVSEQYDDISSESDNPYATVMNDLWIKLEGVWIFDDYIFMNKSTNYTDHTLEFQYIDNIPCMNHESLNSDICLRDTFFNDYEVVFIDEFHYNVYYYRKGEFNADESANWSDDMQLVWYSFDLSNISDGELSIGFHLRFSNGFVDDHIFKYHKDT